jgi:hypothetical protein
LSFANDHQYTPSCLIPDFSENEQGNCTWRRLAPYLVEACCAACNRGFRFYCGEVKETWRHRNFHVSTVPVARDIVSKEFPPATSCRSYPTN